MKVLNQTPFCSLFALILVSCSGAGEFEGGAKSDGKSTEKTAVAMEDNAKPKSGSVPHSGEKQRSREDGEMVQWRASAEPELFRFSPRGGPDSESPELSCKELLVPETLSVRTFHELIGTKLRCLNALVDRSLGQKIGEDLKKAQESGGTDPEKSRAEMRAVLEKYKSEIEQENKRIKEIREQNADFFRELSSISEKVATSCLVRPGVPPGPFHEVTDQQKEEFKSAMEAKEKSSECVESLKTAREFLIKNTK